MASSLRGWLDAGSDRRRSFVPCLELLEERNLLRNNALTAIADTGVLAPVTKFGPLVQVTSKSLFAGNTADNVPGQSGLNYLNTEVEPSLSVDPLNPKHLVGVWQQDRWTNGGARGIITGVSYDGGKTWTLAPVPGATLVAGGIYQRASDPWVSFGPDGGVYLALYAFNNKNADEAMLVYKSTDGGSTWGEPTTLLFDTASNLEDDKESVTADPNNPQFAYYIWDRLFLDTSAYYYNGPAYFSRTTDGGLTWEPARVIYGNARFTQTFGNQIVVTPAGTVVNCFTFLDATGAHIEIIRSTDHGATWSAPVTAATVKAIGITDPRDDYPVRTGAYLAAIAVDHRKGTLYVVWEDAQFSGSAYDSIALSLSKDGGLTWSTPIQINKTPTSIPDGRQQAFTPSVAVAANGNVAVTYYDFRNPDNQTAGLPTDYWIVFGRGNQDLSNPDNWQSEERLTNASFNMELAPTPRGYFLGDYMGLRAGGLSANSFSALFGQTVSPFDLASIFFRDPGLDDTNQAVPQGIDPQPASAPRPALRTSLEIAGMDPFFVSGQRTEAPSPSSPMEPRPSTPTPGEALRRDESHLPRDNTKVRGTISRWPRRLIGWFADTDETNWLEAPPSC